MAEFLAPASEPVQLQPMSDITALNIFKGRVIAYHPEKKGQRSTAAR